VSKTLSWLATYLQIAVSVVWKKMFCFFPVEKYTKYCQKRVELLTADCSGRKAQADYGITAAGFANKPPWGRLGESGSAGNDAGEKVVSVQKSGKVNGNDEEDYLRFVCISLQHAGTGSCQNYPR
jgi:hypothetical protein